MIPPAALYAALCACGLFDVLMRVEARNLKEGRASRRRVEPVSLRDNNFSSLYRELTDGLPTCDIVGLRNFFIY